MVIITQGTVVYSQFNVAIPPSLIFGRYSGLFIVARFSTLAIGYLSPIVGPMFVMEL